MTTWFLCLCVCSNILDLKSFIVCSLYITISLAPSSPTVARAITYLTYWTCRLYDDYVALDFEKPTLNVLEPPILVRETSIDKRLSLDLLFGTPFELLLHELTWSNCCLYGNLAHTYLSKTRSHGSWIIKPTQSCLLYELYFWSQT